MTPTYTHQDRRARVEEEEGGTVARTTTGRSSTSSSGGGRISSVTVTGSSDGHGRINTSGSGSDSDIENHQNGKESKQNDSNEENPETMAGSNSSATRQQQRPMPERRAVSNSNFKDVEDTGKWGSITKKEKCIAASCGFLILVAIVVVVAVLVTGNNNSAGTTPGSSSSTNNNNGNTTITNAPPPPQEFDTIEEKYAYLLRLLDDNLLTQNATKMLPGFVRELDSVRPSVENEPIVMATKWIMQVDATNMVIDQFSDRFALASIYYANNGEDWLGNEGWLSSDHVCKWGGGEQTQVKCTYDASSGHDIVHELDLSTNNLTGTVASTMSLLTTLKGIWLNENALTGAIPGDVFGSLPKLIILYLQDNQFEGEIPVSLLDSGSLGTLYVNGNNLTGTWPEEFCPSKEHPDGDQRPVTERLHPKRH